MTEDEKLIMEKIVEVYGLFVKMEQTHPSDIQEWVDAIHALQGIIGMRILRRDYPEIFATYK
jgi:hypothetical protein